MRDHAEIGAMYGRGCALVLLGVCGLVGALVATVSHVRSPRPVEEAAGDAGATPVGLVLPASLPSHVFQGRPQRIRLRLTAPGPALVRVRFVSASEGTPGVAASWSLRLNGPGLVTVPSLTPLVSGPSRLEACRTPGSTAAMQIAGPSVCVRSAVLTVVPGL